MNATFQFPIKEAYRKTQGYAQTLLDYSGAGLKGHPGCDYACPRGTALYSASAGIVSLAEGSQAPGDTSGYGNRVAVLTGLDRPNAFYDIVYGHLLSVAVTRGQDVVVGQLIGYVDSTGRSTGDHLHFGVRVVEKRNPIAGEASVIFLGRTYTIIDWNNGYQGYIDPEPLYSDKPKPEVLNVDMRYGQPYSSTRETYWATFYREAKVREAAYKAGFGPAEFARMKNAFIYGYWPKEFVFQVANFPLWATMTYPEFKKRQAAGTLAGSASDLTISPF